MIGASPEAPDVRVGELGAPVHRCRSRAGAGICERSAAFPAKRDLVRLVAAVTLMRAFTQPLDYLTAVFCHMDCRELGFLTQSLGDRSHDGRSPPYPGC